jgi:hypothetical protein
MDENKISVFETDQFVISRELLCMFRWLIDNDADRIKRVISRALSHGLHDRLNNLQQVNDEQALEEAQFNILEFFSMLEILLAESLEEHAVKNAVEKGLMPAIDHIDPSACDNQVVHYGLERANAKLARRSCEKPQDILLKEILKNWKPTKKQSAN